MKLYSVNLSPYAARVRMAIYAKGLPVEISYPPPGGPKSPEYLAINPMGKLPAFVTDSGAVLPESEVILEYLEDAHPEPSLRPEAAEQRAKARLIAKLVELYVAPAGGALFAQMNPATRDQAAAQTHLDKLHQGLEWLDQHLGDGDYAVGDALTTADCAIVPLLFWLPAYAGAFEQPDLIERHPKVSRYLQTVRRHPAVAKVWNELATAADHFRATGQFS